MKTICDILGVARSNVQVRAPVDRLRGEISGETASRAMMQSS